MKWRKAYNPHWLPNKNRYTKNKVWKQPHFVLFYCVFFTTQETKLARMNSQESRVSLMHCSIACAQRCGIHFISSKPWNVLIFEIDHCVDLQSDSCLTASVLRRDLKYIRSKVWRIQSVGIGLFLIILYKLDFSSSTARDKLSYVQTEWKQNFSLMSGI